MDEHRTTLWKYVFCVEEADVHLPLEYVENIANMISDKHHINLRNPNSKKIVTLSNLLYTTLQGIAHNIVISKIRSVPS